MIQSDTKILQTVMTQSDDTNWCQKVMTHSDDTKRLHNV
jgi:hypothetical protein